MREVINNSVNTGVKYPKTPFLVRSKFSKVLFICTNIIQDSQTHFILSSVTTESDNRAMIIAGNSRLAVDYDIVYGPITLENTYA